MAEPIIRLDRSKPFGTCHGERTPDDPHYRVAFWQGGKFGKDTVLLPFDIHGELIPDDGKTADYQGAGIDPTSGKPTLVMYPPLYSPVMRKYLNAKLDRQRQISAEPVSQEPQIEEEEGEGRSAPEDDVNFEAWLRGEVRYQPQLLRTATKKRYHLVQSDISEIVRELVMEKKLVPRAQVCQDFQRFLA